MILGLFLFLVYWSIHLNISLFFIFRPVKCGFSKIGCPWRGPSHEASEHEKVCPHPSATGRDVMSALDTMDQKFQEEKLLYDTIFDLMSFEKITFNGKYNRYLMQSINKI